MEKHILVSKCSVTVDTFVPMLDLFNTELTDLLHRLDSRYGKKVKRDGTIMAKKHRKFGGYSSTKPPEDAPEWRVDARWKWQQVTCTSRIISIA